MKTQQSDSLYPLRYHLINEMLTLGLRYPVILLVAFNKIEQQTEGSRPDLILREMQLGDAVVKEPGKQLFVRYPA